MGGQRTSFGGGASGGAAAGVLSGLPKTTKNWGQILIKDDSNAVGVGSFTGTGTLSTTDTASRLGIQDNRLYLEQDTAATIDNQATIYDSGNMVFPAMRGIYRARFSLPNTTSVRLFVGTASTTTTVYQADDPAGTHMAGVQYSTSRGDTNWQLVVKDGTTMNRVNSGVAVSTNVIEVEVSYATANQVKVTLFNATGAQLVTNTFTTNIPTNGMKPWSGIRNLVAATRSYRFFGAAWVAPGT